MKKKEADPFGLINAEDFGSGGEMVSVRRELPVGWLKFFGSSFLGGFCWCWKGEEDSVT